MDEKISIAAEDDIGEARIARSDNNNNKEFPDSGRTNGVKPSKIYSNLILAEFRSARPDNNSNVEFPDSDRSNSAEPPKIHYNLLLPQSDQENESRNQSEAPTRISRAKPKITVQQRCRVRIYPFY